MPGETNYMPGEVYAIFIDICKIKYTIDKVKNRFSTLDNKIFVG
jgi:hypothetical protein